MLRIAIWYENRLGRNDGNPLYVWRCLKRMQEKNLLEVDHLTPTGDLKPFGAYDLHVWVDWGEDGLKGVLPYEPLYPPGHPLIYWASDTHLGYDYRLRCAKQADVVFVAQQRAVDEFLRDGVSATWLPHAVEPEAYPRFNLAAKKYDVCFVGHVNADNRVAMLDRAFKEFPNFFYGQRLFDEAARKYCESRVVLNVSHKDDVNMRTFEALGTKSFLLTNDVPTLGQLFLDGVHLATYRDLDHMVERVRYYLAHDEEREAISASGYECVMKGHTIQHRVEMMLREAARRGLIAKEEVEHVSGASAVEFGDR